MNSTNFQPAALSDSYQVRKLDERDIPIILNLLQGNPQYYRYLKTQPTAENIAEDLQALPPNKELSDKFFLGFFQGQQLVAVLDLILSYPNPQTAFFGLFILDAAEQGKGIGSALISDCAQSLTEFGYQFIRLGFIKGNEQSRCFWRKNGFLPTGIETQTSDNTIVVLQRAL